MCLPMWAHWCHLANTIELVLPLAHPSPQTKRQINRFGRSCTAHGRKSLYLQWALLAPKIASSDGGIWTPSNTWFPGPTRLLNPNGMSIGSAVFAGLTSVTDRQTDRPCYSIGNNRPHLRTYYGRCGLIIRMTMFTVL